MYVFSEERQSNTIINLGYNFDTKHLNSELKALAQTQMIVRFFVNLEITGFKLKQTMSPLFTNETILLQQIIKGNAQSFRKLYEEYYTQVFLFATRLTKSKSIAEDIAQQVFIKVWETRDRIDVEKNFKSYLLTITRNLILDTLKKASRDRVLAETIYNDTKAFDENSFNLLLQKEVTRLHHDAIENLPKQRKIVYKLSREEEMNYEEIASLLGISKNTVRNQISDALKSVRDYMRRHSDIAYLVVLFFSSTNNI